MVTISNDKDDDDSKPNNNAGGANKKRIVIPNKRRKIIVKTKTPHGRRRQHPGGNNAKKGGLPSFQPRVARIVKNTNAPPLNDDNHHEDDDGVNNLDVLDFECEELPCDTLMAIQSLLKSSQGLHIPIGNQRTIQAILESQIFQRFEEGHASTIMSELMHLIQTNQVRKLKDNTKTKTAFVLTRCYVAGVWDAHQQYAQNGYSEKVVSWFVSCLKHWTESTISKELMEAYWKDNILVTVPSTKNDDSNNPKPSKILLSLDDALKVLLKLQVLIRVSSSSNNNNDERYYVWLPNWGLVLKTWNDARQQLLGFIARSKGGEVSEMNVLNQNRHPCVSTKFLMDELTHDGKVRIVQRPFGKFVQRVVDKK
jgi:hypothetical protein